MAKQGRFPWVPISAAVAVIAVSSVAWLRVPDEVQRDADRAGVTGLALTRVESDAAGALLSEQLAAYDPGPMFIPSAMSSSAPSLPDEARPEATGPFASIAPELVKSAPVDFPSSVPVPRGPVDSLRSVERADLAFSLARGDLDPLPLGRRFARVEAVLANTGRVVLQFDVPSSPGAPDVDWQPLEMMSAVARSGLVGDIVVTNSSGTEVVDAFLRAYLQDTMRLGQRLPRGFYVIRIGP